MCVILRLSCVAFRVFVFSLRVFPLSQNRPVPRPQSFVSRYRWVICALLFFATTINYIDRAVLGVLAPLLRDELAWSDQDYGRISAAFTLAYALGFLVAGWFIDRLVARGGGACVG